MKARNIVRIFIFTSFISVFSFFSCRVMIDQANFVQTNGNSGNNGGNSGGNNSGNNSGNTGNNPSGGNSGSSQGGSVVVPPATSIVQVSSNYIQSGEVTSSGLTIPSGFNNLYTITISYPSGEYDKSTTGSYTLKGSGSIQNSMIKKINNFFSSSFELKSAPGAQNDWKNFYPLYSNTPVTAKYYFTDENNKTKYYITPNANKDIWGVGLDYQDFYSKMSNALVNSCKKDGKFVNLLKSERESFGLAEYDKDQTPYFYIIFEDFGQNSATYNSTGLDGKAGIYSSRNIRTQSYSNEADIFYVNARFMQAYMLSLGKQKRDIDYMNAAIVCYTTLLHEYMHYLMDANKLKSTEDECGGSIPMDERYNAASSASMNFGSKFYIEGTANYAPYRMIGSADPSAVSTWLRCMNLFRPAINENDKPDGDDYSNYGAGGLFFSYIAERYGDNVVNKIHAYRDKVSDLMTVLPNATYSECKNYVGNINRIIGSTVGVNFKDVYVNFLMQLMTSLDPNKKACMKNCSPSFTCPSDWGWNKEMVDDSFVDTNWFGAAKDPYTQADSVVSNATSGVSGSNLPQLSFKIHRWDQIPSKLTLVNSSNVRTFAVWF